MVLGAYPNASAPLASLRADDVNATSDVYAGLWAAPAQDVVYLLELDWRPPQAEP